MMLSEEDIKHEIEKGNLVIDPLSENSIRPAGLRLHLGAQLLKPLPGKIVDPKLNQLPDYETITITDSTPYLLNPGEFILGATFERVTVGLNLGFLIEGRSTLARVGLTIVQTAMLVNPGHANRAITLELANHGPNAVRLYPKMKIARAVIFEFKTRAREAYDTTGKYKDQVDVGAPIFREEIEK